MSSGFVGKKTIMIDSAEDQCGDIATLLEMLTNILSKDYIDFGTPGKAFSIVMGLCIIVITTLQGLIMYYRVVT